MMGGKYCNVMPSDLFKRGALAQGSLPAPGQQYASSNFREELRILMRRYASSFTLCVFCGRADDGHSQQHHQACSRDICSILCGFDVHLLCTACAAGMLPGMAAIIVVQSKAELLGTIYRLISRCGAAAKTWQYKFRN